MKSTEEIEAMASEIYMGINYKVMDQDLTDKETDYLFTSLIHKLVNSVEEGFREEFYRRRSNG